MRDVSKKDNKCPYPFSIDPKEVAEYLKELRERILEGAPITEFTEHVVFKKDDFVFRTVTISFAIPKPSPHEDNDE